LFVKLFFTYFYYYSIFSYNNYILCLAGPSGPRTTPGSGERFSGTPSGSTVLREKSCVRDGAGCYYIQYTYALKEEVSNSLNKDHDSIKT